VQITTRYFRALTCLADPTLAQIGARYGLIRNHPIPRQAHTVIEALHVLVANLLYAIPQYRIPETTVNVRFAAANTVYRHISYPGQTTRQQVQTVTNNQDFPRRSRRCQSVGSPSRLSAFVAWHAWAGFLTQFLSRRRPASMIHPERHATDSHLPRNQSLTRLGRARP
jgi:hypothetical protein